MTEVNDTTTRHTINVQIERDDRPAPIDAGSITMEGLPFDLTEADARAHLIEQGHLIIGGDVTTFGGTIVPTAKLDRVTVTITSKTRPRTPEEEAAYQETLAQRKAAT